MEEFFARLKQHKLVQWALAYVAVAFALIPVLDIVALQFDWPEGMRRGITLALSWGFLIVLVLAWYHGVRGVQKMRRSELLILAVLLAAGGTVMWRLAPRTAKNHASTAAMEASIADKSIAVLPFANESTDPRQDYFSDGLSEELISSLTQIDGLKVIGKASSFQFRDSKDGPETIGAKLGVSTLLEGSTRRQGDRIRVVVGLVKAADGSNLWSQTYDRELKDIFAVQSDIGHAVATALKVKLLGKPVEADDKPLSGNIDAYNAYLQGRFLAGRLTVPDLHKSLDYYNEAIRLDPHFANSYAGKTYASINLGELSAGEARALAFGEAREAADKALELAPDMPAALRAHAYMVQTLDLDFTGALAADRRAYELVPHDARSITSVANDLSSLGQLEAAVTMYRKALTVNPLDYLVYSNLATTLAPLGHLDEAEQAARKAVELAPNTPYSHESLAIVDLLRGRTDAVLQWADKEPNPSLQLWYRAMVWQPDRGNAEADAALKTLIERYGDDAPSLIATAYARRRQPDEMFHWLEHAWKQRDSGISSVLSDPFLLSYKDDPRFALFCRKVGLPVPGASPPKPENSVATAAPRVSTDARLAIRRTPLDPAHPAAYAP